MALQPQRGRRRTAGAPGCSPSAAAITATPSGRCRSATRWVACTRCSPACCRSRCSPPDHPHRVVTWPAGPARWSGWPPRRHARSWPRSSSSRCCRARAACIVYDPGVPARAARGRDDHGLLLVVDEIATGFGRTGTMFACEQPGWRPTSCAWARLSPAATSPSRPCSPRAASHATSSRVGVGRAHARPDLHGQPARVRGRLREPRPARRPTGEPRCPASRRPRSRAWARCPTSPASSTCGCSARSVSSSSTSPSTWTGRPPPRRTRASGCGRSATSSTRCRPTSPAADDVARICAGDRRRGAAGDG